MMFITLLKDWKNQMKELLNLKYGDYIGIFAPSNNLTCANKEQLEKAKNMFEEKGFKIVEGKHIWENWHGLAGTPQQRSEDFHTLISDKKIKAVICIKGGEGCNTVLPCFPYRLTYL